LRFGRRRHQAAGSTTWSYCNAHKFLRPAALAAQKEKITDTDTLEVAVRRNEINQVMELRNMEPVLSRAYEKGTLLIIAALYDLGTGLVEFLPETMADLPRTAFSRNSITSK
jgi:carbonic anhydrase